jgi:hypothetical protein
MQRRRRLPFVLLLCVHIVCQGGITNCAHIQIANGAWCMHNLPIEQLPHPWSGLKSVLVDNKIYMKAELSGFIILDLLTSSFSTIGVPQGVEYNYYNTILSRADAAASVYLIHVKQFLLCIWLYKHR